MNYRDYMSSLKGRYIGDYYRGYSENTGSLDCSSCRGYVGII